MNRLLRSIVLCAFVGSLFATAGCQPERMALEAETALTLPLMPALLPTWERPSTSRIHTVPRNRLIEEEHFGWTFLETVVTFIFPLCMPRWDAREVEAGGWWEKRPGLWKGTNEKAVEREKARTVSVR